MTVVRSVVRPVVASAVFSPLEDQFGAVAAPIVANQSADFGALTLAGDGGWTPTNTGGTITSATIDSGTDNNHWQIASDGTITPSSTGDTADLNGGTSGVYTLTCTFTNDAGDSTADITLTCSGNNADGRNLANCYSLASDSDITAWLALEGATDGKIALLRPGTYGQVTITATSWSPKWTAETIITSHDSTDRANINYDGSIYGAFQLRGVEYATLDNLKISKNTSTGGNIVDVANGVAIVINECEIVGDLNPVGGYTANGIGHDSGYSAPTDLTITNNNIHDVAYGVSMSACDGDFIATGNHISRFTGDGIKIQHTSKSFTTEITRISQNTFSEPINPGAGHSDGIQFTGVTPGSHWTGIEIEENIFDFHNTDLDLQCIFMEGMSGTYAYKDVQINRNAGVLTTTWGIGVTYLDGGYITNNTFVWPSLATGTGYRPGIYAPTQSVVNNAPHIFGNICELMDHNSETVIGGSGHASNIILGQRGATNAYTDVFTGSWSTSVGPTSRAELLTFLAMKANGPADVDDSGDASTGDAGAIESGAWTPPTATPGTAGSARDTDYETYYDPPLIDTLSPADDATDVAVDAAITLTFDRNVAFDSSVSIGIYESDDTPVVEYDETDIDAGISISGAVLTITNPGLTGSTAHYIQVSGIKGGSGTGGTAFAGISDETTWTFTAAASGPTTVFEVTLSGSETGFHGYTVGDRIAAANLSAASGDQARVTIAFSSLINDETVVAYIGQRASSGDAFDATALVQLTGGDFGGGGTYTHSGGTSAKTLVSDFVTLNESYDETKDYLVFAYPGGAGSASVYSLSVTDNRNYYVSGDVAATADKTTMADNGEYTKIVAKIEIQ